VRPAVASFLEGKDVLDAEFDASLFPSELGGLVSRWNWTPLVVVRRAAALLADGGNLRILDVGSGVGKFCIAGALTTEAWFVGVEQRAYLVEAARESASRSGAERASFIHSNVLDVDFAEFDAFYFFNPFLELIDPPAFPIDRLVPRSPSLHGELVATTCQRLRQARPGTRVVTYGGFGGEMPKASPVSWRRGATATCLRCGSSHDEAAEDSSKSPIAGGGMRDVQTERRKMPPLPMMYARCDGLSPLAPRKEVSSNRPPRRMVAWSKQASRMSQPRNVPSVSRAPRKSQPTSETRSKTA
jgi:SAM-dependent methyltransferase